METLVVDSSEAVGNKDKLGLDGHGDSEDSVDVCLDVVHRPSFGLVVKGAEL